MNRLPNLGGFTPSDLENMGMDFLLHLTLTVGRSADATQRSHLVGPELLPSPLTGRGHGEGEPVFSSIQEPASVCAASTADQIANRKSKIVNRRRPRSKASQRPPDIQLSLNTMLASGCTYREIICRLNDQGHPGFNKVNLHNWKSTGYQQWLSAKTPEATS